MPKIDITQLNAGLGSYFRQNREELVTRLFQKPESFAEMTATPGVKDELVHGGMDISEVTQAFQCDWTPKGSASIYPMINKVHPWKIDVEFDCLEDLERSWAGWAVEEGKDYKDQTIFRYVLELIIKKALEEREMYAGIGVRTSPTTGIAGAAINAWDGFLTVIADLITAGVLSPIVTGPIVAAGAFSQIEDFVRALPIQYQRQGGSILSAISVAQDVMVDFRNQFPTQIMPGSGVSMPKFLDTNVGLKGLLSMAGSQRLLYTPKDNFLYMYDIVNEVSTNLFKVSDAQPRKIQIYTEGKLGFGFKNYEKIFVNDQV